MAVDGDLYVRAYNGGDSRWYQAAISQGAGQITAAGRTSDVTFEAVTGSITDRIDDAYRAKYATSPYLQPMIATARPQPRLYVSVRTIETHVSAVLRKLQLSNRTGPLGPLPRPALTAEPAEHERISVRPSRRSGRPPPSPEPEHRDWVPPDASGGHHVAPLEREDPDRGQRSRGEQQPWDPAEVGVRPGHRR